MGSGGPSYNSTQAPRSPRTGWSTESSSTAGCHAVPQPLLMFSSRKKKQLPLASGAQSRSIDSEDFDSLDLTKETSASQFASFDRSYLMDIIGKKARLREKEAQTKVPVAHEATEPPRSVTQATPQASVDEEKQHLFSGGDREVQTQGEKEKVNSEKVTSKVENQRQMNHDIVTAHRIEPYPD